jgi:ribose transport system ATP-binding protein
MNDVILSMTNVSKAFGPVKALKNATLELRKGEVHALMGENGAGKSTLMKVLTGIYTKDTGSIVYDSKEVEFTSPKESQEAGISIVHQELNMMNHLTVAQNIFIGRESMKMKFFTNDAEINRKAKEYFKLLNLDVNPKEVVGNLTVGKQQMVEIIKAISMNAKVVVFDEPTTALTRKETEELFKIIEDLKSKDIAIVYITHRMEEIFKITDKVTVMRDGEYVGQLETKKTTKDEIISMMVGRVIYEDPKQESNVSSDAEVVLSVKKLSAGRAVKDVSFELRKGEILGFAGLMGAGRTEVARLIFGADKKDSGEIYIKGKQTNINSPKDAVENGIGYLSEDRKQYGILLDMDVSNNTILPSLDNYIKNGLIEDKRIDDVSTRYIKDLNTKTPSTKQILRNLSGGNQQKVVIAKWLARDCDILIFDEPTKGIDVGAKSDIYSLMNELTKQGKSIIMISSDMTEVLRMSDRIAVMCEGRKTGELSIEDSTQEKILYYATLRKEGE